jgi:hypothetical protein
MSTMMNILACLDVPTEGPLSVRRCGTSATRRVEPHQFLTAYRPWYVLAFALVRADWRDFRVAGSSGSPPSGTSSCRAPFLKAAPARS